MCKENNLMQKFDQNTMTFAKTFNFQLEDST